MDKEAAREAFKAGQDSAFREQVIMWAGDPTITNDEFGRLVADLGFRQALEQIEFNSTIAGVDESQPSDVE